ncbi:hypothetical protein U4I65_08235 [Stenotrophomonas maltophilia]|uniref:hypothetical protein n=1 Tax=Stenotrophomonas maltophilia group TaxID=995085 RepID=UPI0006AA4009|nr:hypothetical protein [Stenotrophomonas maltophilia]ALA82996.1 hypothetical protein VN11_13510 [Stenotrophomonas maltophilia]MDZ5815020.1 hypothetical protein [Stenotrophomonas maltophilia]
MATMSLGVSKAPPTVVAIPSLGVVAIKVGAASLYIELAEADRLSVEIQHAAHQLRGECQDAAA